MKSTFHWSSWDSRSGYQTLKWLIPFRISRLAIDCDFQKKTSIHLAADRKSAKLLANEARARRNIQLDVKYHRNSYFDRERFMTRASMAAQVADASVEQQARYMRLELLATDT